MLRDDFFVIEEFTAGDTAFSAVVRINDEHAVFAGHFPGQPVVPGVFTLQMARECAEFFLKKKLTFTVLKNCKFSNVIIPDRQQTLHVKGDVTGENRLEASVSSGETVYLSLKGTFTTMETTEWENTQHPN